MGRKSKHTKEEKISVCKRYQNGESAVALELEIGVNKSGSLPNGVGEEKSASFLCKVSDYDAWYFDIGLIRFLDINILFLKWKKLLYPNATRLITFM